MTRTWQGRRALGTGHIGKPLESIGNTSILPEDVPFCEHHEYCVIRKSKEKICFSENTPRKQCQKFYDRYGKDYNQLGVGC